MSLENSELGKQSSYLTEYGPGLLFAIPRDSKRQEIGIETTIPFVGVDIWNHFEVSWLNPKGKPVVAIAEISIPCESTNIIESKSMKLYFNSFNNTKIESVEELSSIIKNDLSNSTKSKVEVKISLLNDNTLDGICIDNLDVNCSKYTVHKEYLTTNPEIISETICSHLLKSNCLVTKQPDWGSVQISYQGPQIDHVGLLKYIVSFRNHNEFHEQCIERIFIDIMQMCKPTKLSIYGRYTRRGGLDINVYRSTHPIPEIINKKMHRQ